MLDTHTVRTGHARTAQSGRAWAATGRDDRPMRLAVIGLGYLGPTRAVCMADLGHAVIGLDTDAGKVASAAGGAAPSSSQGSGRYFGRTLTLGGSCSRPHTPRWRIRRRPL